MEPNVQLILIITNLLRCNGVSLRRQLEHVAETQLQNEGFLVEPSRRNFYKYDPRELSGILGAPSMPSHLPEAEPILPGHTLIKPALGMLKSSVKFPHRDLEDGSGVYGNYENIGIRYDAKNERVLYSGFRRMLTNDLMDPDPKLRANNEITLYLNDNKEPFINKKNGGEIYLKRIYASNQPTALKKYGTKDKSKKIIHPQLMPLRSDVEDEIKNSDFKDYFGTDNVNLIGVNHQDAHRFEGNWNSKNTFNHIAIDQNAQDYSELSPPVNPENTRQWWFYNEEDWRRPLLS